LIDHPSIGAIYTWNFVTNLFPSYQLIIITKNQNKFKKNNELYFYLNLEHISNFLTYPLLYYPPEVYTWHAKFKFNSTN